MAGLAQRLPIVLVLEELPGQIDLVPISRVDRFLQPVRRDVVNDRCGNHFTEQLMAPTERMLPKELFALPLPSVAVWRRHRSEDPGNEKARSVAGLDGWRFLQAQDNTMAEILLQPATPCQAPVTKAQRAVIRIRRRMLVRQRSTVRSLTPS